MKVLESKNAMAFSKTVRFLTYSAVGALSLLASSPAFSTSSTFDSNTENWSVMGDVAGPVTWNATGGNPNGYISVEDSVVGGVMYFVAPSAFLGNQSGAYGTSLTFDLIQNYPGSPDQFPDSNGDVLLQSSGLTLAYGIGSNPGNGTWTSYSVSLTAGAWHVGDLNGDLATDVQIQTALSGLTGLFIRAEYQDGPDTDGLDNVVLFSAQGATPIPAALPLLGSGLAALGLAGWRRKKKLAALATA